jgi:hypothetical protein
MHLNDEPTTEPLLVTTSQIARPEICAAAEAWAARLGGRYVPRDKRSLSRLCAREGVTGILVVGADIVEYAVPGEGIVYFHHLGLAGMRLRNLEEGRGDPMVTAMGLGPGDHVLDCTLGRGVDAAVAAVVVGPEGRVVGLEVVPVLAALAEYGLPRIETPRRIAEAARRIEVRCVAYQPFLASAEADSFDVVYFDPVFTEPVEGSTEMIPVRRLASKERLTAEAVAEARRVARRRVVVKHNRSETLPEQLGVDAIIGGHHSRIGYAIIEAGH